MENELVAHYKYVTRENVNVLGRDHMTPLYRLCWYCSEESDVIVNMVKWLISIGANVNRGLIDGNIKTSTLWLASNQGFAKIVDILIKAGARSKVDTSSKSLPVHVAAARGHHSCLALLVAAFPTSVLLADAYRRTALHRACQSSLACCSVLLMAGSRLDVEDNMYLLPVHYTGNVEMHFLLMDFGPTSEEDWKNPKVIKFSKKRTLFRTTCLALLQLRLRRARCTGRNGRDLLRIVAQFIWSQRHLTTMDA